ncbi:hypothetical protein SRHO_G00025270 [Serrasalmus rhombeus]
MPSPGSQLQFQAFGAGETHPITAQHGEFCGCTVQAVLYCIVLGASYFACLKETGFQSVGVSHVRMLGSVVSGQQIMFEKEGQHSEVMSAEKTAAVDYFLMSAIGRIVFRTAFGRPYATIKMILWETPIKTPLFMKSDFEDKLTSYRVTGHLLDKQMIMNQGHDMAGSTGTLGTGMPYVSSEEFKKNLLENQHYHKNSFMDMGVKVVAPLLQCEVNGISFKLDHKTFKYMREFIIGPYPLTQQLAHNQGYIMINDGLEARNEKMKLDGNLLVFLFKSITLQQFSGTFEILTRNAKTLEFAQSSARRCRFKTTELLVCATHGVMTVLSDVTEAVLRADPARATLLDRNCKPRDFDIFLWSKYLWDQGQDQASHHQGCCIQFIG